jgi:putative heme-binding domain-containing protein
MKMKILLGTALLAGALTVQAQRGLKDIPNPDVKVQQEAFKLPKGAKINLFASDPQISKPIHMNWDGEGRLWVVSSPLYPLIQPGQEETDRLYILEDTNGDGTADKITEFADNLHIPTAVLPGDGGVYVANSTEMIFIRDSDGDGKGDDRRVVLSGFGTEDTHHLLHTFRWGPAGHLWMNQSIYIHSHVETPYGVRRLLGGGMWHYRPESGRLEVFMKGLVNSWGHAFDDWGQSFMTDGAGGNGINFVFPRGVYQASPGAARIVPGLNPGQPKHCSLEIATGRHVPEDWLGTLMAPDFRGHRINRFKLSEKGSAYSSTQIEDLVSSTHRAFRPIDVKMGPDGGIYIADWYNPIIQHGEVDFRDSRRDHKHGRIWRITFPDRALVKKPNIVGATPAELVKLLDSPEGLTRTLVAAELRQRKAQEVMPALEKWAAGLPEGQELQKLRALWGSQAVGAHKREWAISLLSSKNHKARAAALRALYYRAGEEKIARSLIESAVTDPHPQVRLWAVSVLAQLDWPDTVSLAVRALEGEGVDVFLDFAVWSICREHADRWEEVAQERNPFRHTWQLFFAARALKQPIGIAHVLKSLDAGEFKTDAQLKEVVDWIANVGNGEHLEVLFSVALADDAPDNRKAMVLKGLSDAVQLRRQRPAGDLARLTVFLQSGKGAVFAQAAALAGRWKLEGARPALEKAFLGGDGGSSNAALEGLRSLGGAKTRAFFGKTAKDTGLAFEQRVRAVIGQTRLDPKAGAELAVGFLEAAKSGAQAQPIVDAFLVNKRGPGALAAVLNRPGVTLLPEVALVGANRASSAANKSEALVKAFQKVGKLKPMKLQLTKAEMEAMIIRVVGKGDPARGEKIYRRAGLQCVVCHAIGGAGGIIGPDLVSIGASAPVDYLVESLLEPSKKIKEGYHTAVVTTKAGDVIAGAVAREDEREVVIRDATGKETRVPKSQIASKSMSPVSLMPLGLTANLREDEYVDLVRFLSELGKEGAYKTTPNRFVRHWLVLQPHPRTPDGLGHYGTKFFADDFKESSWTPMVAKVNGGLPAEELPRIRGRGRKNYGVGRFTLEVSKPGKVTLKISGSLKDLDLFVGGKEVQLPDGKSSGAIEVDLQPGQHKVTVVGLLGVGLDEVSVELLGDAGLARALTAAELK